MKIAGIASAFPSLKITMDDTLELIKQQSEPVYSGNMGKLLRKSEIVLEQAGLRSRYWLDEGEDMFSHIERAYSKALKMSSLNPGEIDACIYASVDRQFFEPGQSSVIAKRLGLASCHSFDIVEACMSWTRAMEITYSLLQSDSYKNILIITSEFTGNKNTINFKNYRICNDEEFQWKFPSMTIGECATATIVSADKGNSWRFEFNSLPTFAHLCYTPVTHISNQKRLLDLASMSQGETHFYSDAAEMKRVGSEALAQMAEIHDGIFDNVKLVFPHTHEMQVWKEKLGAYAWPFYFIFPETGNLVTSGIPAAIARAYDKGLVVEGDELGIAMASAGLSFAFVRFTL